VATSRRSMASVSSAARCGEWPWVRCCRVAGQRLRCRELGRRRPASDLRRRCSHAYGFDNLFSETRDGHPGKFIGQRSGANRSGLSQRFGCCTLLHAGLGQSKLSGRKRGRRQMPRPKGFCPASGHTAPRMPTFAPDEDSGWIAFGTWMSRQEIGCGAGRRAWFFRREPAVAMCGIRMRRCEPAIFF
jgi:hypothetical protein